MSTQTRPTKVPDQRVMAGSGTTTGASAPTLDHIDLTTIGEAATSAPTASPPGTAGVQAGDEAVTGTWTTNVTIDATWSIDETRNAYVHVAGGAWKKIFNARDGSFQALLTLATQARQTGSPVSLREEADGMVYEIYLW